MYTHVYMERGAGTCYGMLMLFLLEESASGAGAKEGERNDGSPHLDGHHLGPIIYLIYKRICILACIASLYMN